ncbi:MAG: SRPBCC family protein [Acidobacteriia bacterium]|nr:SRPBCC family protein [Terriglobia bacterium]
MTYDGQFEQWVPVPLEQVFLFFTNPGNLPRIMPPATGTEVVRVHLVPPPGVANEQSMITDHQPLAGAGSELVTSFRVLPFLPFRAQWIALITQFEWNHHFADVQKKGPFRRFQHRHEFEAETRNGVEGTRVRDVIAYEIGFGFLGALAQKLFVARQFRKIFAYRQSALEGLLQGKRP